MFIAFAPALPGTVHVIVPVGPLAQGDHTTAVLNFSATLDVADYEELERRGGKIQLWMNRPSTDGGDWSSRDFQETTYTAGAGPGQSTTEVLLGDVAQDDAEPPGRTFMSLQISVPLSSKAQLRFAFTYRIMYSNGNIKWLGAFGQNGTLIVEGMERDPAFVLAPRWISGENGHAWKGVGAEESTVISIAKPDEYDIWTLDGNAAAKNSHLTFLVPRPAPHSVYTPPTYVLCASADARFRVLPDGNIIASGTGTLFLQPLQSHRQGLEVTMELLCSSERVQSMALDEGAGHLLIASRDISPVQGIVIRPFPYRTTSRLLPLTTISALLPAHSTPFTLFSPQNHAVHFFPDPSTTQKESITLTGFGPFVLSPTLSLNAGEYEVSVLSPYKSALPADDSLIFPTPPPSPHLRPVAHPSSLRSAQGQPAGPLESPNANKEQRQEDETPNREQQQLIVHPRVQALLAQFPFISAAFFVLATVFRFFFGGLSEHEAEGEKEKENVGDVDELEDDVDEKAEPDDDIRVGAPLVVAAGTPSVSSTSTSLIVDVSGGTVVLALRARSASEKLGTRGGAAAQLTVEMGGKDVSARETLVEGGVSLFEFDGGEGGLARVRIAPAV